MSKIKIKFLEPGRWMDEPNKPVFDVTAGQEMEVTARLANIATKANKAEFVLPDPEPEPGPVAKAERKKSGARPKAERKS